MADLPGTVHLHGPDARRTRQGPRRSQRRCLVRSRRAGLRPVRPHDLRRSSVDPRRPLHHTADGCRGWLHRNHRWLLRRLVRCASVTGDGHLLRDPAAARRIMFLSAFLNDENSTYRHRRQGRPGARDLRLAQPGAVDEVQRPAGQAQRLRAGGSRSRCESVTNHSIAHPAERPGSGHRGRDHQPGCPHRRRGNVVVPRYRPAARRPSRGVSRSMTRSSRFASPRTSCCSPACS